MFKDISEIAGKQKQCVTVEFPVPSKKMISKDKSPLCVKSSLKQKSSKTSEAESVSKEKVCVPFWNEQCGEISSKLFLPTETDYADSGLTSLNGLSRKMVVNSWFCTKMICHQNRSLLRICYQSSMSSHAGCTDSEVTRTKLQRISPSREQKKIFKKWTDCSRFVFNKTFDYIRSCVNFTPSWMDIKKDMLKQMPSWCDAVPFQIKGIAIKEAHDAFFKAKGQPSFRRLKDPEQSCFVPKSAISLNGIYPRISGKGLMFTEEIPENILDSRLIWRFNKWWLATPYKRKDTNAENQGRVVSLDPGVRTFITFYSPEYSGKIGISDFSRIQRLCYHLDNLIAKRDLCKAKQRKKSLTKATRRMQQKIKDLINELHHKAARFLVDNFDVILLPTFETKDMVSKSKRKIRSKTVRSMLTFAHYRFKMFLKWKARQTGKEVVDVSEAYTSKTHPQTGVVKNIGGAKRIRLLNGSWVDRDIVGAFNILLKALVDSPSLFLQRAVNES